MSSDPLGERLKELLEGEPKEGMPESRFTPTMRKKLKPLFDLRILGRRRSGAGVRIYVENREGLKRYVDREYRSGVEGVCADELTPKAAAVALWGDSKRGRGHQESPLFLRGFGGLELKSPSGKPGFPVGELTSRFELAALCIDEGADWGMESGQVVLVENFESFRHVEKVFPEAKLGLYTAGVMADRVLMWLAGSFGEAVEFVHFADYDPKGLEQYERIRGIVGERLTLFVPPDFEELLEKYGKRRLLDDSSGLFERLRGSDRREVRELVELMFRYGKGLEQEALLIGAGGLWRGDSKGG